jgi:hypothetical protein
MKEKLRKKKKKERKKRKDKGILVHTTKAYGGEGV